MTHHQFSPNGVPLYPEDAFSWEFDSGFPESPTCVAERGFRHGFAVGAGYGGGGSGGSGGSYSTALRGSTMPDDPTVSQANTALKKIWKTLGGTVASVLLAVMPHICHADISYARLGDLKEDSRVVIGVADGTVVTNTTHEIVNVVSNFYHVLEFTNVVHEVKELTNTVYEVTNRTEYLVNEITNNIYEVTNRTEYLVNEITNNIYEVKELTNTVHEVLEFTNVVYEVTNRTEYLVNEITNNIYEVTNRTEYLVNEITNNIYEVTNRTEYLVNEITNNIYEVKELTNTVHEVLEFTNVVYEVTNRTEYLVNEITNNIYEVTNRTEYLVNEITNNIYEVKELTNTVHEVLEFTNVVYEVKELTNTVHEVLEFTNVVYEVKELTNNIYEVTEFTNNIYEVTNRTEYVDTYSDMIAATNGCDVHEVHALNLKYVKTSKEWIHGTGKVISSDVTGSTYTDSGMVRLTGGGSAKPLVHPTYGNTSVFMDVIEGSSTDHNAMLFGKVIPVWQLTSGQNAAAYTGFVVLGGWISIDGGSQTNWVTATTDPGLNHVLLMKETSYPEIADYVTWSDTNVIVNLPATFTTRSQPDPRDTTDTDVWRNPLCGLGESIFRGRLVSGLTGERIGVNKGDRITWSVEDVTTETVTTNRTLTVDQLVTHGELSRVVTERVSGLTIEDVVTNSVFLGAMQTSIAPFAEMAETYATAASVSATNAEAAASLASDYRVYAGNSAASASAYMNQTGLYKDEAKGFRDQAEGFRYQAMGFRDDTSSMRDEVSAVTQLIHQAISSGSFVVTNVIGMVTNEVARYDMYLNAGGRVDATFTIDASVYSSSEGGKVRTYTPLGFTDKYGSNHVDYKWNTESGEITVIMSRSSLTYTVSGWSKSSPIVDTYTVASYSLTRTGYEEQPKVPGIIVDMMRGLDGEIIALSNRIESLEYTAYGSAVVFLVSKYGSSGSVASCVSRLSCKVDPFSSEAPCKNAGSTGSGNTSTTADPSFQYVIDDLMIYAKDDGGTSSSSSSLLYFTVKFDNGNVQRNFIYLRKTATEIANEMLSTGYTKVDFSDVNVFFHQAGTDENPTSVLQRSGLTLTGTVAFKSGFHVPN